MDRPTREGVAVPDLQLNIERWRQWHGHPVVDETGAQAGTLADVYFDERTAYAHWALIRTGLFGEREAVVPLIGVSFRGGQIVVPYSKEVIGEAPHVDADEELSKDDEKRLAQHYGLIYAQGRSDTTARGGNRSPGSQRAGDEAMTRSEEELKVGKARRPSELIRLRKYIVTEEKQVTVPVQREEVRVEREPVTEENLDKAMAGPDLQPGEHEETLHEEEVVVQKRVVPKERVRVEKDTVTEEEEIKEELRKEQIDIEREKPSN
jgi:uncharacterized protein (TIGR02271 family)